MVTTGFLVVNRHYCALWIHCNSTRSLISALVELLSVLRFILLLRPRYLRVCMYVCMSVVFVCLSVRWHTSKTTCPKHTKMSVHFCHLGPWFGHPLMAMQYVMYVRFCGWHEFYIIERMGQNQRRCVCFDHFSKWRHRGEVCRLRLHIVWLCNFSSYKTRSSAVTGTERDLRFFWKFQ